MSKIGTAHVEIKAVLNEASLAAACTQIEVDVAAAMQRGLASEAGPQYLARLATCVAADVTAYYEAAKNDRQYGNQRIIALGERILTQVQACKAPEQ